jgi:hypothetical protein
MASPIGRLAGTTLRSISIRTREYRHYWRNWNDPVRQQFVDAMRSYKVDT